MPVEELPISVQRLRKVVITMGFVLVFGTIALFIAIIIKFSSKKPAQSKDSAVAQSTQTIEQAAKCSFKANVAVKVEGDIINSSISGNILTLVTSRKQKLTKDALQEVILLNLCSGDVVSQIKLSAK